MGTHTADMLDIDGVEIYQQPHIMKNIIFVLEMISEYKDVVFYMKEVQSTDSEEKFKKKIIYRKKLLILVSVKFPCKLVPTIEHLAKTTCVLGEACM